jgi:hypothetical protein
VPVLGIVRLVGETDRVVAARAAPAMRTRSPRAFKKFDGRKVFMAYFLPKEEKRYFMPIL